jgi:hypothetical protein
VALHGTISGVTYDPVSNLLQVAAVWIDDQTPTVVVASETRGFPLGPGVGRTVLGWVAARTTELTANLAAATATITQIQASPLYVPR